MFAKGGNAVDAAVAMLAAGCTMWDTLSCGGETQALIYNPHTKKVIGINALGVAPSGASAEFYHSKGYRFPPEYGPLAAITPGTPGALMTMLAGMADCRSRTCSRRRSRWRTATRSKRRSRARSSAPRMRSRSGSTRPRSCSRIPVKRNYGIAW